MGSASFQVPPGYRDSSLRPLKQGEVIASTYVIHGEIARTDSGLVFEAQDMMLDRLVAFKLAWRDPGTPSLILEARRCAAVANPCAVSIHGMGNHNGVEFVVGERVTGRLVRELLVTQLAPEVYLRKLRTLIAAVAHAHECGIAIGDISGSTVLIDGDGRMVLGRLSLSQVPAFGPLGQILAPEVVRGEVEASDPAAAEAIDLYGLGCIAIELACGHPPFSDAAHEVQLRGHGYERPPRLVDLRPDLPGEVSDLVEWLLEKLPAARPRSARDVLAQLDAVTARLGTQARSVRVLVVDDDTARARWLWSLARRAHASAVVEIASEGTEAAHKLNRDHPDLVFVDASLRGVMNALELCMYARGLELEQRAQLVLIGEVSDRDRALFAGAQVAFIADDAQLAESVLERVRSIVAEPPRRRKRSTISG
ncbi:MAG: serine/threonine protein kinase [Deltaproteobacteria bacterium]|nr:serine/threonine protein kinase [Deltaproteobacteria bacterium]